MLGEQTVLDGKAQWMEGLLGCCGEAVPNKHHRGKNDVARPHSTRSLPRVSQMQELNLICDSQQESAL